MSGAYLNTFIDMRMVPSDREELAGVHQCRHLAYLKTEAEPARETS
jgi:hypothetical protein